MRGNRVEADVGEKHDRRPEHDPRQAVRGEGCAGGVVDGHQPAIKPQKSQQSPGGGLLSSPLPHGPSGRSFSAMARSTSHWRAGRRDVGPDRGNHSAACRADNRPAFSSRAASCAGPFHTVGSPSCFADQLLLGAGVATNCFLTNSGITCSCGSTRCVTGTAVQLSLAHVGPAHRHDKHHHYRP